MTDAGPDLFGYDLIHEGHCASGWMGDNISVNTVWDCAIHCSEREGCGYFAYMDNSDNSYNCVTYFESDGCPDDNSYPKFDAYKITRESQQIENYYVLLHDGHCAIGWMGNNIEVDTRNECATLCKEREECGYFSFDDTTSYGSNCATYFKADGCPDDNLFPQYKSYEVNPSYSFLHEGHCASGWMGDNRSRVDTADECAYICSKRNESGLKCGYFAYDASDQKCAFYFESDSCPDDNLYPNYRAYKLD